MIATFRKKFFMVAAGLLTLAIIIAGVAFIDGNDEKIVYEQVNEAVLKRQIAALSPEEKTSMYAAGQEVLKWQNVFRKRGDSIISNVVTGKPRWFAHYPRGDIFDVKSASQYYFHTHRNEEYGHFHIFLREDGFPENIEPVREKDFVHLIAVSVDDHGVPRKLFTTHQWVTGEGKHPAHEVAQMVSQFSIEHEHPSWALNQWMGAMLRLFKPQIVDLLKEKEACETERPVEVASSLPISVELQVELLLESLDSSRID